MQRQLERWLSNWNACYFAEGLSLVPSARIWQLSTASDSYSVGIGTLFWPLQAPPCVCIYTCTCTYNYCLSKKQKKPKDHHYGSLSHKSVNLSLVFNPEKDENWEPTLNVFSDLHEFTMTRMHTTQKRVNTKTRGLEFGAVWSLDSYTLQPLTSVFIYKGNCRFRVSPELLCIS